MNLTSALLDPLLADGSAAQRMGPRITYYDDASGERTELSTVTLANWAAKTANLLRDEFGAGPASRAAVLLPAHWQTAAVLLGIWWIGAEVVPASDPGGPADIALCTRGRLDEADAKAPGGDVAVLTLDPFGRAAEDLPVGVTDYATAVRVHGDHVAPEPNPGPAISGRTAEEVLAAARASAADRRFGPADRVMSSRPWTTAAEIIDNLLAVWAAGASLVQLANPDPTVLGRRRSTELVTTDLD
ncbi:MAG: TIGR03089 family protein [Mycobacterium sp.]|nr:TIGR03089 family protein [Mycobacterium sp.]